MNRIIDTMPTMREVETATPQSIVEWHLYLRPVMMNEELDIVKAVAQRYDRMSPALREQLGAESRRGHR